MKKSVVIIISIVVVFALVALWIVSAYNKIVVAGETLGESWANVESQYQRRADLIPNLVNTVKGYAEHEKSTLGAVVAARAKATQVTVDPSDLSSEKLAEFQAVQGEVAAALGRLMMLTENYPDLKANANFLALQEQLEGTENRIQTSRKNFNAAAKLFNTMIRRFPNNLIASMFGFEKKAYFEAESGAGNAPEVQF